MADQYFILAPLPQLTLHEKFSPLCLETGFSFRTLPPQLRRSLLNTAKKDSASDDLLRILVNSDTLFMLQVPQSGPAPSKPDISGVLYSVVAHELLRRLFNFFLLFDWVPPPLLHYPWCLVRGTFDGPDLSSAKPLDSQWEYVDTFNNIDWRSSDVEPVNVTLPIVGLREFWPKLKCLCQFDLLNSTFTDPAKRSGYWAAAEKNCDKELRETMKAQFGDTVVVSSPTDDVPPHNDPLNATPPSNSADLKLFRIPEAFTAKWMLDGYNNAYMRAVKNLSTDLSDAPSRKRFSRAFQFFVDAFRVHEPHRYVAFSMCLESLLCTQRSEVTFQLAGRAAWLISPDEFTTRKKVFDKVKQLYRLRCEIVHGTHYSATKLEDSEDELTKIIRNIFHQIISSDNLWTIFNHKDQKVCDAYLDGLNLGAAV